MDIQNEIHHKTGRFYIEEENETVAELDCQFPDAGTMLLIHTEVTAKLEGKGIGKQLVSAAADYARKNLLKITATCSYAKVVLARGKEYSDVYNAEK